MRALALAILALTAGSAHAQFSPPPGGGSVAAITSGTIDGAAIGGTTPATGSFTTIAAQNLAATGIVHGIYAWSNLTNAVGAGTTLATATTIGTGTVKITACTSGAGLKLPAAPSGTFGFSVIILVRSGTTCLLYPASATGTIEGGTAGAPVTLASGGNYEMVGDSALDWLQVSR